MLTTTSEPIQASSPVLLRQREAADMLGVSVRYLRASDAPRIMLPSLQPGKRPLLRYDRTRLLEWARSHDTTRASRR